MNMPLNERVGVDLVTTNILCWTAFVSNSVDNFDLPIRLQHRLCTQVSVFSQTQVRLR